MVLYFYCVIIQTKSNMIWVDGICESDGKIVNASGFDFARKAIKDSISSDLKKEKIEVLNISLIAFNPI